MSHVIWLKIILLSKASLLLFFLANILWLYLDHVSTLLVMLTFHLPASAPPTYFTLEEQVFNLTRQQHNFKAITLGLEMV